MVLELGQGKPTDQPTEPMFTIKVQGVEKEVTQTELLELAQKGDDYTVKTQELAKQKDEMEKETQRKAEELAYEYMEKAEQERKDKQPPIDENLDPQEQRMLKLEQEIASMKKGSEESKVAQYELQFETQLKELKGTYSEMDERVVLAMMMANPKLDMKEVAKESHETSGKKKDAIIKDYLDSKKKQPKTEGGGGGKPPITPQKDLTAKDLSSGNVKRAAAEAIKQELAE